MNKIILSLGIIALIFTSCEEPEPRANFSADYDLVIPNEVISFTNSSYNANYYEWDFGDGNTSVGIHATHYYTREGVYTVRLAAYNGSIVDYSYLTVEVYETTLEVQVVEWHTEDIIPFAEVTLYPSFIDWEKFTNPIIRATADEYGVVVFKGLATLPYYIDVRSRYTNNESLGFEDIGFIKTLPLEHAMHNVFVANVDYLPPTLKAASASTSTKRVYKPKEGVAKRSLKDSGKVLQSVRK